ncbi:hypothetical protein [Janthinobacterium sp. B9-8]|uniref:hypothetical protein n=1 Tax=Janthinobacterium sp. B9-8 TaxID=1236179 RepID=UPI00061D3B9D|nr:hypothetical protein [Janthinobacterium sp. B9-8]AMC34778.1 hypothetical protein VN23_09225 [Janthinobacterium sp. B9-8]
MSKTIQSIELYQPSNGTEGELFISDWCANCEQDKEHNCPILGKTMQYNIDDPEYPKEWVKTQSGPKCTVFIEVGGSIPIIDTKTLSLF